MGEAARDKLKEIRPIITDCISSFKELLWLRYLMKFTGK
jgi:hypothetical protein